MIVFFVGIFSCFSSCKHDSSDNNSDVVKQILFYYFDGIKNRDLQKLNALTTADFVLYEDGKIFNNDSLINLLNSFSKFSAKFELDSLKINVDNNIARIFYTNRGDFIVNDTLPLSFNWLESATFRKENEGWKMDFLDSTVRK